MTRNVDQALSAPGSAIPHVVMKLQCLALLLALLISCALLLLLLTIANVFSPALGCCSPSLPPVPLSPSPPSPAVCADSFSPIAPGGFSRQQSSSPYIQRLITAHSTSIQRALNLTSSPATVLTALTWCSQVVHGTNYAIAVEVAGGGGEAEGEGEGDVGVRRVVEVGIFEGDHSSFSGEVARRLKETDTVRSEFNQVNGVFLGVEQRSWSEHDMPTM